MPCTCDTATATASVSSFFLLMSGVFTFEKKVNKRMENPENPAGFADIEYRAHDGIFFVNHHIMGGIQSYDEQGEEEDIWDRKQWEHGYTYTSTGRTFEYMQRRNDDKLVFAILVYPRVPRQRQEQRRHQPTVYCGKDIVWDVLRENEKAVLEGRVFWVTGLATERDPQGNFRPSEADIIHAWPMRFPRRKTPSSLILKNRMRRIIRWLFPVYPIVDILHHELVNRE